VSTAITITEITAIPTTITAVTIKAIARIIIKQQ
jgi:hypothetical protein